VHSAGANAITVSVRSLHQSDHDGRQSCSRALAQRIVARHGPAAGWNSLSSTPRPDEMAVAIFDRAAGVLAIVTELVPTFADAGALSQLLDAYQWALDL
jgi:hypothetical protein